jgi:hypothetical protein
MKSPYPRERKEYTPPPPAIRASIAWIAFFFLVAIMALIVWPFSTPLHASARTACLSNVKQLGRALLLYQEDEEALPPPASWQTSLPPLPNPEILHCPEARKAGQHFGYAINGLIPTRYPGIGEDEQTPLILETPSQLPNAIAVRAEPAGRHGELNCLAFTDGHVKALKADAYERLRLEPPGKLPPAAKNMPQLRRQ